LKDEQDNDDVDGSEDVKFGTGATGGDVMDSYASLALKFWEGGAGHNAAESSGHSAPGSSITTTSNIGEFVKHTRNTIVSTVLFAR